MIKLYSNILLLSFLFVTSVQAGTLDDIGYTKLKIELAEFGLNLPDGAGVAVAQVEAPLVSGECIPDTTITHFLSITFIDNTPVSCAGASWHATSVAKFFYGSTSSTAPGITDVDLFEAVDWLQTGFLNISGGDPNISTSRLANHSWVGGWESASGVPYTALHLDILRRVDFVVEQDEFIQVVSMSATPDTDPVLSDSFNAIVVGMSSGSSGIGTSSIDSVYTADRARPDIVAPESPVSMASPRVASAASLLIGYAIDSPSLSTDPLLSAANRNSVVIPNAERSETIKAVLMAGADRNTLGNTNSVDIIDYRLDYLIGEVNYISKTSNGLDTRFGAGQLNIYNSYHILAGGEQNSVEDKVSTAGAMSSYGFDYDPSFGGLNSSNTQASYYFSTSTLAQQLRTSLVWNLEIASSHMLYDMDLKLFDVTSGGQTLVASSNSVIDNTENIWINLSRNRDYMLQVIPGSAQANFDWDYALAWQITAVPGVDEGQVLSVDENSINSTVVGTVTAAAPNRVLTGYSIVSGDASNVFAIDNSGVLTVAAAIDYENAVSYTLGITVTDGVDISVPVDVVVTVNNVNDVAPVIVPSQTFNIDENSGNGVSVDTVVASDVDSAISGFTIESGDINNIFIIGADGVISVAAIIDYETTPGFSYTLSITATDGINTSNPVDVIIDVNNLTEISAVVNSSQNFSVNENSANATTVGTVTVTDAGSVVTDFNIVPDNTGNIFAIDNNGVITVSGVIDYETTSSYTLRITASDGINDSAAEDVVINVNNIDEVAPVVTTGQSFNVNENAANATVVGTVTATDAEGAVSGFNIVSGNTNNVFSIASNGTITVSGAIDYESTTSYTLSLTATDGINTSTAVNVTISVNDVNDVAPVIVPPQGFTIDENSSNGTIVGTVAASDVDSTVTGFNVTSGNTNNAFAISSNGVFTVSGPIDYETTNIFTLTITATDGINVSNAIDVVININDVNDIAPVIVPPQVFTLDENIGIDTTVGTVTASDADSVVTGFNIVSGINNNEFTIASDGIITVSAAIEYEASSSYTLGITATDGINSSNIVDVVININDLDDIAPVIELSQVFDIDENSENATEVGTITATDIGGVVSGFNIISGNTDNIFSIANSGVITVSGVIDYETTTAYKLAITATDGVNTSIAADVAITVNDIDETKGGSSGGALSLMWLLLPLFITVSRRRVLH